MDHAYEALISWYDIYLDQFMEDWFDSKAQGRYYKYSDCPSYQYVSAIVKALNCLAELAGCEKIDLRSEIKFREE